MEDSEACHSRHASIVSDGSRSVGQVVMSLAWRERAVASDAIMAAVVKPNMILVGDQC